MTKPFLIVWVILVGPFVLSSNPDGLRSGTEGFDGQLIAGATWDVLALAPAGQLDADPEPI